ncbi:MAG: SpoIIE family protein phosphatase [Chloroflexi bacterium]|nr:SpoIIE family protein phosphatase [Chloroflexota bacterium]
MSSNLTARLNELEKQVKNLQLLHDVSLDLTSTLDLERVLLKCLERVQKVLGSASASILMLEGDELVFKYAIGEKADEIKPFHVPLGQGISGWVALHKKGTFTNDVQNDPRYYRTVDTNIGFVTRALLAAPLIINARVIGVISATNKPNGFSDADLELLSTIGAGAAIAIENARLYQVAIEKGRLERELQVAREVQASLIPNQVPRLKGWDFAARWQPAREVSGDFYDFIPVTDTQLGIVIADVSDKGMPAALFMSLTRAIMRASATPQCSPAQSIAQANRLISADASDGMFVTLFYALIDSVNQQFVYVNAGHNPPLLYRANENALSELARTGIAAGISDAQLYQERAIEMRAGDFVVMYTDGITEAENSAGEQFGDARLRRVVEENCGAHAAQIVAELEKTLSEFVGDAAPMDDVTVVVVKKID